MTKSDAKVNILQVAYIRSDTNIPVDKKMTYTELFEFESFDLVTKNYVLGAIEGSNPPLTFDKTDLVLDGDNGYYLPVAGLDGLWPISIRVKDNSGHTITGFTLEDDDLWDDPRYYGFANNTDEITISILYK